MKKNQASETKIANIIPINIIQTYTLNNSFTATKITLVSQGLFSFFFAILLLL